MQKTVWKRLTVLSMAAVLAMTGCGKTTKNSAEEEALEEEVLKVEVVAPTREEIAKENSYIGTVMAGQQIYVVPMVSGTVTEVNYKAGDHVSAGDVLFKIDDEPARLQKKSAQATYNQAKAGVVAATGGARELQEFQTQSNINTLKDTLSDTNETLDDLYDQWDEINNTINSLPDQIKEATAAETKAADALKQVKEKMAAQGADYDGLVAEKQMLQDELETLKATGSAIDPSTGAEGNSYETTYQSLNERIAAIDNSINSQIFDAVRQAQSYVDAAALAKTQLLTAQQSLPEAKVQLEAGIQQAENGKEQIENNLELAEGVQAITRDKVNPQTDASYKAQLAAASIAIESADYQLDMYTVTAPISGVVDSVAVSENQMTSAGSQAFVISDKSSMSILFFVTDSILDVINVGDTVKAEGKDGELINGTITEIGGVANQQLRMFQVKAEFPGAEEALENGTSAKLYVETQKEEGKLSVPFDALHFSAGEAYLFCLEDGEVVRHSVTVGLMNDTMAVIEDGIDENSQVVSSWSSKLRNHAKAEAVTGGEE